MAIVITTALGRSLLVRYHREYERIEITQAERVNHTQFFPMRTVYLTEQCALTLVGALEHVRDLMGGPVVFAGEDTQVDVLIHDSTASEVIEVTMNVMHAVDLGDALCRVLTSFPRPTPPVRWATQKPLRWDELSATWKDLDS